MSSPPIHHAAHAGGECCKSFSAGDPPHMPRTESAVHNLEHLQACCHNHVEPDDSGIQHPHAPFMARAIE